MGKKYVYIFIKNGGQGPRVQAPSDVVPLTFGLHCTCFFSYLSKPLNVYHPNIPHQC